MQASIQEGYFVPHGEGKAEQIVKNSRFIGTAGYAATSADAQRFIAAVSSRYPDASHHAWAYIVDQLARAIGSSDDGEPGGTAGRPMLAVLEGSGLTDVVVVGTRYFGGTKLGPGGLVRAYSAAAREAIAQVERREYRLYRVAKVAIPYALHQWLLHHTLQVGCRVLQETYGAQVEVTLAVPLAQAGALRALVADASSGQLDIDQYWVGEQYLAYTPANR